jgi:hypothetical protein
MTIPEPPTTQISNQLDFVVMEPPPNDNTDGQDCPCGHAEAAHQPTDRPDADNQTWQCLYCACTRAYPARVPLTS